ncbi:MAG: anti-sigma factor [Plectolyngbya sp. WJT66-NPBG17]|jgi:anti-sigma-K factor RskA|nr:anti-sigma factor [Plectolyngbya sp. WJT66-NPBG17]
MTWSMASEHLQFLIAGYVLGNLDPDEAAEFEQLLIDQPAIATEVDRMQKALELSSASPEIPPPAHLRSAILAAQTPHTASAPRSLPRRSFGWNRAMNVAAAVAIVALGINNYRLRQALQVSQTETRRLAPLVYALQATQSGNAASATVEIDPNRLEAVLTVQNLPPLPPGKVYALWTVVKQYAPVTRDTKNAILTEVFNVDAQGTITQSIAVPSVYRSANLVSNVAVTIEDAAAPQNHQGKPVMLANL